MHTSRTTERNAESPSPCTQERATHPLLTLSTSLLVVFALLSAAHAALPANRGDITADGKLDVTDVNCMISASLNTLTGEAMPECMGATLASADIICDGKIDILDVQRCATLLLYALFPDPSVAEMLLPVDGDLDLLHDSCDADDDGDTFPDTCEIAQSSNPKNPGSKPANPQACTPCAAGCFIGGQCLSAGFLNPQAPCQSCQPAANLFDWTAASGAPCNDGNACTLADQCQNGVCAGPVLVGCDDLNSCTTDFCDPLAGCQNTPAAGPCTDGNACTANDTCAGGFCTAGPAVNCDDNNVCTSDSCKFSTGCAYMNNALACNDGNPCTTTDTCGGGTCKGGAALNCNDGNACTLDSCSPLTGCGHTALTGTACLDGDACTTSDICAAGTCVGVPVTNIYGCGSTDTVLCSVTGALNSTVSCPLLVAKGNPSLPAATAVQFTLDYDPKKLELVNFFDTLCFAGAGCFNWNMTGPGSLPMSTGHSVSPAPTNLADWKGTTCNASKPCQGGASCVQGICKGTDGFGGVLVVNSQNPTVALSPAHFSNPDTLVGDATILTVQFKLLSAIPLLDPAAVVVGGMQGADGTGKNLDMVLYDGVFVTYPSE